MWAGQCTNCALKFRETSLLSQAIQLSHCLSLCLKPSQKIEGTQKSLLGVVSRPLHGPKNGSMAFPAFGVQTVNCNNRSALPCEGALRVSQVE